MPFCVHGEPDHKCAICQAPRLPSGVAPQVVSPKALLPSKPQPSPPKPSLPKPLAKAVQVPPVVPVVPVVPVLKPIVRSTPPGPPPTILVNGVSKPGPVSSGLPIVVNPAVRGGGVKLDQNVVQEFWRTYTMLGVTDKSAEEAVAAAIRDAGVAVVDGFDALELAEKFALYNYTSVEFTKWNTYLRTKKGNYKAHCDLVSSALAKLSAEVAYATTYRIEKFSDSRHLPMFSRGSGASGALIVGTEINFAAFSSTAFNIKVVEQDPQFSGAGSYVKYVISGHAGKRVNFLSTKPLECEILIDKGAKFRIIGGPEQKMAFDPGRRSGAIEIHIEQVL